MAVNSPIPQSRLQVTMKNSVIQEIRQEAKRLNLSQGVFLERVLKQYFENEAVVSDYEDLKKQVETMAFNYNQFVTQQSTQTQLLVLMAKNLEAMEKKMQGSVNGKE